MPDCYCKREYLDPSVRRMRSNDGIVHGVNGCFSSGETGVGGRSWEKRALDAEEKVQRVREFCAATNPIRGELHMAALHGWDTAMEMVLQLLESGEIKGFTFRIANLEGRVDD